MQKRARAEAAAADAMEQQDSNALILDDGDGGPAPQDAY